MKKIKMLFGKMRIQNKVLSTYILLIIAPLLCFFIVANITVTQYSQKEVKYSVDQSMELTSMYINRNLYNLSKLANTVMVDNTLYDYITRDYDKSDMYELYGIYLEIDNYMNTLEETYDIDEIYLYIDKEFNFMSDGMRIKSFENSKNEDWYKKSILNKNVATYSTESLHVKDSVNDLDVKYIVVTRFFTQKNNFNQPIGAIRAFVQEKTFQKIVSNSVTTVGGASYIVDDDSEIITASENMSSDYYISKEDLTKTTLSGEWKTTNINGKRAMFTYQSLEYGGWKIVNVIPNSVITSDSKRLLGLMMLYMVLILIAAYILAYFISKSIVSRIVNLSDHMLLNDGSNAKKYAIAYTRSETNDEIDILTKNYNEMLEKIEEYTILQYENGKKIKNAELKLLQEQINPHFLYNVLDVVNWLAIKSKNNDIEKFVHYVSQFYKIGLNSGNETITLLKELEHVEYYFKIQKIRFENIKGLTINVPKKLMNCIILKTIFQPLVENAINHGIRDKCEDGEIIISAEYDDNTITFLVSDNGKGISDEIIEKIKDGSHKSTSGSSIGLKNLNERIKIYYGDEYGITFGDCTNGAKIYVKIPRSYEERQ